MILYRETWRTAGGPSVRTGENGQPVHKMWVKGTGETTERPFQIEGCTWVRGSCGNGFIQWPHPHSHFLLLSHLPVGTAMVECWPKTCEPKTAWVGLLLYRKNKKPQTGTVLYFCSFPLNTFPCLEYGWKVGGTAVTLWIRGDNPEDKSQHTKDGEAERQKEPGSLKSLLRIYISPELLAYL